MKTTNRVRRTVALTVLAVCGSISLPAPADDELLYRLGGGEAISLGSSARTTTLPIGVSAQWNANLTCGNFDVAASIRNQLNGISGAFQEVMGNVIQTAQGVVASLPALVIQRLNPGLYDLLQNGILEAGQEFRVAKLRCDEISDAMADKLAHESWAAIAEADFWRRQAGAGGRDAVEVAEEADSVGADDGVTWIGGDAAGGAGQDSIEVVGDVASAGYNLLLGRSPGDTSTVSSAACGDSDICQAWDRPDDVAAWMRRVVGETEVRTCDGCRKLTAQAGLGLQSLYREHKSDLQNLLRPLVQTSVVPGEVALGGLTGGGGFQVTRRLIEAIREEPKPVEIADRLAGELAVGRVLEQAAMARRAMLAGMREPNVADNEEALKQAERALTELDREIGQMEMELRVKAIIASNSSVAVLRRAGMRKRIPVFEAAPGGSLRESAPQ